VLIKKNTIIHSIKLTVNLYSLKCENAENGHVTLKTGVMMLKIQLCKLHSKKISK